MTIDCDGTINEIVCPYCGYKHVDDLSDYQKEDGWIISECFDCSKDFICNIETITRYSTEKIPCNDGGVHVWKRQYEWNGKEKFYCSLCRIEEWREPAI